MFSIDYTFVSLFGMLVSKKMVNCVKILIWEEYIFIFLFVYIKNTQRNTEKSDLVGLNK